jgi:hypothetical protein
VRKEVAAETAVSLDRGHGRFYGRTNKTRFKKTEAREQKFSPIEDQG